MADILNNIEELVDKDEKLIDIWGRRTPKFEKKYEQSVMRVISDYGIGASENTGAKGKILGAGYEPYIMAFFIGLGRDFLFPMILMMLKFLVSLWTNGVTWIQRNSGRHTHSCVPTFLLLLLQRQIKIICLILLVLMKTKQ